MGVPRSGVVPERELPHAWVAHEVGRAEVERGDVEGVAHDGEVEVGPDHQPERGAPDEVHLTEWRQHVVERELGPHCGRRCCQLLRGRHRHSVTHGSTPGGRGYVASSACARSWSSAGAPTPSWRGGSAPHLGVAAVRRRRIDRFSNDCLQVQLQANCRQRDVYIVQPLVPPTQEHLMELLLMLDAARGASAAQITAVIPHYAYARSDKKDASRISIGGRLVADLLVAAGANRVITMALHAPQVHGFFGVPVDHLTAIGELAEHFRGRDLANTVVVSPGPRQRQDGDPVRPAAGRAGRGREQAAPRRRPGGDRRHRRRRRRQAGRSCSTTRSPRAARSSSSSTGSRPRAARRSRWRAPTGCSPARPSSACATTRRITEVVTTDTVPPPTADWPDLQVRSVAALFAEAIHRSHIGESVSSLFDGIDPAHAPPQPRLPFDEPM